VAAMNHRNVLTIFLSLLLGLFLLLTVLSYHRGTAGRWTSKATELFVQHRWSDVVSLAENLDRTGTADAQTLLLAAISADYLGKNEQTAAFVQQMLRKNAFNMALETSAAGLYQEPPVLLDRLKLYRSRLNFMLLLLLSVLVFLSILQRKKHAVVIGAISATGCVLLLL
jgi:hypothetical protein